MNAIDVLWKWAPPLGSTSQLAEPIKPAEAQEIREALAAVEELQRSHDRWLAWSEGRYPDDSPGDVIHALSDGTITLDDGVTTWNPLRALAWIEKQREDNAAAALARLDKEQP